MENKIVVLSLMMAMVMSGVFFNPTEGRSFGFRYQSVKGVDGEVRLPLQEVSDGKAHYYSYKEGGKNIKFFVVKSRDGVVRAAFDACDVCFPAKKGYSQDGDYMVCKNCGRKFHSSKVNVVEGGCNPAPLMRQEEGGQLVIKVKDILPGGRFF